MDKKKEVKVYVSHIYDMCISCIYTHKHMYMIRSNMYLISFPRAEGKNNGKGGGNV